MAWVEGSSNTSTHPPLYGRTQKEAAERLHQTQQIWNGQYIQTASLSRAPGWVLEWADATAALVEAGGSEPDAEDIPRRQSHSKIYRFPRAGGREGATQCPSRMIIHTLSSLGRTSRTTAGSPLFNVGAAVIFGMS